MFDNHTYSILYGLFRYISPVLTLWYVYLYFFKLYPRMAKASLLSETAQHYPEKLSEINDEDAIRYAMLSLALVSLMSRLFKKKS